VKIVGFDTSPSLVADLREHTIDSLVLQDPFQIGYLGLEALLDRRAGGPSPARISLPPLLVKSTDAANPEAQHLLSPDVRIP
jgi:ribose transport system substrate-binding protein